MTDETKDQHNPTITERVSDAAAAIWETAKRGVHEAAQEPVEKYELPSNDAAGTESGVKDETVERVKEAAAAVWDTAKKGVHDAAHESEEKYELPPKVEHDRESTNA